MSASIARIDASYRDRANWELESTLTFAVPTNVAQGEMFDRFCSTASTYEHRVHRITRIGDAKWRIGTIADVSFVDSSHSSENNDSHRFTKFPKNRFDLLTRLTNPKQRTNERRVSEMKVTLVSHRYARYIDSIGLFGNIRYRSNGFLTLKPKKRYSSSKTIRVIPI